MVVCCDDVKRRWEEQVPTQCKLGMVVLGGILVHITLGTVDAAGNLGVYVISYVRARAWPPDTSNTQVEWVVAMTMLGQGLGMLLGGWLNRVLGPRAATAIGSLVHSASTALTAVTVSKSFGAVLVTYGLMVGVGTGMASSGPLSAAIAWAPSKRGMLTGLVLAGRGLGASIFNPVITAFINPWNYSPEVDGKDSKYFRKPELLDRVPPCFLMLGLTYFCMQGLGCLLITTPPPSVQYIEVHRKSSLEEAEEVNDSTPMLTNETPTTSLEEPSQETPAKDRPGDSAGQVLRSRLFYSLWASFVLAGVSLNLTRGLYKAYGLVFISDDHFLAGVGAVASVCNATGRVMWGLVLDKLSVKRTFCLVSLLLALLTLMLLVQIQTVFAVVVCLVTLTYSGLPITIPVAASLMWGHTHFPLNYGLLWSAMVVNALVASLLGQVLQQHVGWTWVFCISSMITTLGVVIISFTRGKTADGSDF